MFAKLSFASSFSYWYCKNWYYHRLIARFFRFWIPAQERVLHIGCTNGYVLSAIQPSYGVGIDSEHDSIACAQAQYPQHNFYTSLDQVPEQLFDYIILSCSTMQVHDVQDFMQQLHGFCHARTRLVIDSYNYLWEPVLWITQKLRLRRPVLFVNWLSRTDIVTILYLAGYEVVLQNRYILLPTYIPLVSYILNTWIAPLPLINALCLQQVIIARPLAPALPAAEVTISVIVPCRNERGNIVAALERCPQMGKHTELIFVEGHSRDGTREEIERVIAQHPYRDIKLLVQKGIGKADAMRMAFEQARGDVLMILDADLTMPPEELPKFLAALLERKGEFINGCRLVYGMESEAMRFLNLIANYCFARLFTWLLGQSVKDTLCGTKVLFARDYQRIAANRRLFGDFDPFGDFDLLFGAARLVLKIVDMPIHYKNRVYGSTNISRFRHGILLLKMSMFAAFRFKFRS